MPSKEPSRTKLKNAAIAAKSAALPKIPKELLDRIVAEGPMTAEQINATTMALKKALIERALGGELPHHLGYPRGAAKPEDADNQRNGSSAKTVRTDDGPLRIEVPRDAEQPASRLPRWVSRSSVSRTARSIDGRSNPRGAL